MKTDPVRAEQDEQILRLRCAGLSLRAIGARVGLSHQGVSDRITAALAELVAPAATEYRQLETARLDDLACAAYEVLDHAETQDLKLKAIDRLTRLSESRRKLLGLDATEPIAVTLSRRADVEGDIVGDALVTALEVLAVSGLPGERQEQLRVHALELAQWKLLGGVGERPVPPGAPASAAVVEESVTGQAGMEARLRELVAGEDVDVDALLAEVDEEEGRDG